MGRVSHVSNPPNIYHQAVMRQALEARGAEGREEKSVVWMWMPGSSFASERVRERGSGEAKEIRIDCMLFADDTTVVGTKGEMDESVRRVKWAGGRRGTRRRCWSLGQRRGTR